MIDLVIVGFFPLVPEASEVLFGEAIEVVVREFFELVDVLRELGLFLRLVGLLHVKLVMACVVSHPAS